MKRTSIFLIPIILIALLLCSCNADAQDGIFSAIADSSEDSGVRVQAYLGQIDGTHYILTDSGVQAIGTSSGFTTIQTSSNEQIKDAFLDTTSKKVYTRVSKSGVHDETDSKLLCYNQNGVYESVKDTNVKWLTTNGVYYTEKDSTNTLTFLYEGSGSNTVSFDSKVKDKLESEDYVFVELENGKIFVYKKDSTTAIIETVRPSEISGEILGFQVVGTTGGSESFLLVANNSSTYDIYSLTNTDGIKDTEKNLVSTPDNGKIYSLHYQSGGKDYVAFKTASFFDLLEIEGSTYSIETINTAGYASKLRTSLVSNIVPSNSSGKFVVATYSNSIWEVDPTSTGDPIAIK